MERAEVRHGKFYSISLEGGEYLPRRSFGFALIVLMFNPVDEVAPVLWREEGSD